MSAAVKAKRRGWREKLLPEEIPEKPGQMFDIRRNSIHTNPRAGQFRPSPRIGIPISSQMKVSANGNRVYMFTSGVVAVWRVPKTDEFNK
jgi:hypothetical protein